MKYYYLDGINKLGPYTLDEILSRNLSKEIMIFREDKSNWAPLSDFDELNNTKLDDVVKSTPDILVDTKQKETSKNILTDSHRKSKKLIVTILSVLLVTILFVITVYFIYQRFTLSEDKARDASNRFFNMLILQNEDDKEIVKLYPSFSLMGSRLIFNNICIINNISRTADGDYEVYASYEHDKFHSYPVYLLISREYNKTIIKSSKGISYAYYDKVLEYGKKKGCLTGNEDDVQMGLIISEKRLRSNLKLETDIKMQSLYDNIITSSDIRNKWGTITGNVTITNNNDIDFNSSDIDCRVEFYNRSGQITSSEKVYLFQGVGAHSSASGSVFSTSETSSTFKIIPTLNTDEIRNKIRNKIVDETEYGCN